MIVQILYFTKVSLVIDVGGDFDQSRLEPMVTLPFPWWGELDFDHLQSLLFCLIICKLVTICY